MKNRRFLIRIMAVLIAVVFLVSLLQLSALAITVTDLSGKVIELPEFEDTKGHWAEKTVNQWQYYEIVTGIGKNKFDPNGKMSRRDFMVVVDRIFKYTDIAVNSFTDLEMDQYYTIPILKLNAKGIVSGEQGGKIIRPHDNITREEAATILCKAFELDIETGGTDFVDDGSISAESKPYIKAMQKHKYIKGDLQGKFNPKSSLTRAEAITIIDNMIKAFYDRSGEYVNEYIGNGFINKSGISLLKSNVAGNLYIAPGLRNGDVKLNNTIIQGNIVVLAPNFEIGILNNTEIRELLINADRAKIINADKPNKIVVKAGVKDITIDKVPKEIVLNPGASIEIQKVKIDNQTDRAKTYYSNNIEDVIASDKGTIEDGPEINMSGLSIDIYNNVKATGIRVTDEGDSGVVEVGVVYNKNNTTPSYKDNDGKEIYKGNKDITDKVEIVVYEQAKNETWTYRAYAINSNGKIGYSKPMSIKGYSFDIKGNIIDTYYEHDREGTLESITKKYEILVYGSNIPKISKVTALSSQTTKMDQDYTTTNASKKYKSTTGEIDKISYIAEVEFDADRDTGVVVDKYYGYRVEFGSDIGISEKFPTSTADQTTIEADVKRVSTGEAYIDANGKIAVKNNSLEEGNGIVIETGVVTWITSNSSSAPASVNTSADWKKCIYYTGSGQMNSTYSLTTEQKLTANMVCYYASYTKTTTKITFGEIKCIAYPDKPIYKGINSIKLNQDKTTAIIDLKVLSSLPIDLLSPDGIMYVKGPDNKNIDNYTEVPLTKATALFKDNRLVMQINGLVPNKNYSMKLKLTNDKGFIEITFNFNTNK